jgi:hypothetical protein
MARQISISGVFAAFPALSWPSQSWSHRATVPSDKIVMRRESCRHANRRGGAMPTGDKSGINAPVGTPSGALMPDLSPVGMAPPKRFACRQLTRRMTILSDGTVARCDQDWLGQGSAGNAANTPLIEIWRAMQPVRQAHAAGKWDELELCRPCRQWHRP